MSRSFEDALDKAWTRLDEGNPRAAAELARKAAAMEPEAAEPRLLEAECAWALGDLKRALFLATEAVELSEAEEEVLYAVLLRARLLLELGDEAGARETLNGLPPPPVAIHDPGLALDAAELLLDVGDVEKARERFRQVTAAEPELADGWYGMGMCEERLGNEKAKTTAWSKVLELDGQTPVDEDDARLSEAEVAEVAEEALEELPTRARELLRNVPIVVADAPASSDVASGMDPRLLGLFAGTPYPEQSSMGAVHLTQILLFRRNLERVAEDTDELREEIRVTLLHETGHFFGMSEKDLEAVGLD